MLEHRTYSSDDELTTIEEDRGRVDQGERLEYTGIQLYTAPDYATASYVIHSNRTKFDLEVTVLKEIEMHDIFMNMKLKMKMVDEEIYHTVYNWKRIDVCKFLVSYGKEDTLFKYFLKSAIQNSTQLNCPFKIGTIHMRNFGMENNWMISTLPVGKYRFYLEVAHVSGESTKLITMQVSSILMR
ncbi:uncharacterized protein LOC119676558 [Teleopsis dalmanni]|uniref:uncharacterized protein LOC119676558 n=1 Tax=Teleopsis dalmanni TaxID=139649 RepID=UPI0018CEE458|nr:uncharacterized protein LOC119676558 [Teleopsis dalmanni]